MMGQSAARSWVARANLATCGFPLTSLPWCVLETGRGGRIGVGIGDAILDLRTCADSGLLEDLREDIRAACRAERLNALMALGTETWSAVRNRIRELLCEQADSRVRERVARALQKQSGTRLEMPVAVGDYTDFYASAHHARRVGSLFRPENPLLPNYPWIPIGYHGRASSVVVSGTAVQRPHGQRKGQDDLPVFAPTEALDYEAEIGFYIGSGNAQGRPIPVGEAEQHLFGLTVLNDWSARDMQSWEYQPLGPFLAKSFATSISPWVVPLEALEAYRVPGPERDSDAPAPLAYLRSATSQRDGFDVEITVELRTERMREAGMEAIKVSRGNLRALYWTLRQMVTHHTSNGCNLRAGDLLATGTISGAETGSEGCLLEMQATRGALLLPNREQRRFLADGDEVTIRAEAARDGLPRIALGSCTGVVLSAVE